MRSRFTVILFCLCLTLRLWAESWHLPLLERLPLKQPLMILTKTALTGNRSLLYGEIVELGLQYSPGPIARLGRSLVRPLPNHSNRPEPGFLTRWPYRARVKEPLRGSRRTVIL